MLPKRSSSTPLLSLGGLLFLAVGFLATAAVSQPGATKKPATLHITGSVVDSDGQPLPGVVVELRTPPSTWQATQETWNGSVREPAQRTRTGGSGDYRFKVKGPGFYKLSFHGKGLGQATWAPQTPVLEDLDLLPVELRASRTLSLTVTDSQGTPIPAARLIINSSAARPNRGLRTNRISDLGWSTQKLHTDELGLARFHISHTRASLRVSAPGYLPAAVEIDPGKTDDSDTVELPAARLATVRILAPDGTPAQNAAVLQGRYVLAMTDEQGHAGVPFSLADTTAPPLANKEFTVVAKEELVGTTFSSSEMSITKITEFTLQAPQMLTGRTTNKDTGKPVVNAWVWTTPAAAARSSKSGSYTIPHARYLAKSSVPILRSAATGFFGAKEILRANSTDLGQAPTLVLSPAATIFGHVTDAAGVPIAGAKLTTKPKDFIAMAQSGQDGQSLAFSRSDGSFLLRPLPVNAALDLVIDHPDFAKQKLALDGLTGGSKKQITVRLVVGARAYGRVVDESDRPVPNAQVELTEVVQSNDMTALIARQLGGGLEPLSTSTDNEGRFRFNALAAGRYDLAVKAPSFAPAKVPAIKIPAADELGDAAETRPRATEGSQANASAPSFDIGTVTLSPGAIVEGVVRSSTGRTLAEAEIRIKETGGVAFMVAGIAGSNDEPMYFSDEDGRFLIDSLAPGTAYKIDVELEGYAGKTVANVKPPTDEPLLIKLEPAATLRGVVTNELGEPMANVNVSINQQMSSVAGGMMNINARRMFKRDQTDDDGRFSVKDLGAGKWDLTAQFKGYIDEQRKNLEIEPGVDPAEQRITLRKGASLVGIVLGSDGKPVPGVTITKLVQQQGLFNVSQANRRVTKTDGDGHYALEGLPLGKASFSAKHEAHQEQVRDAVILAGENRLDMVLERGLRISGRVKDPTGLEVAGARVKAAEASAGFTISFGSGQNSDLTAEDGSYSIEGLSNGTYTVTATKDGYAEGKTEQAIKLDGSDVSGADIQLATGAAISGIVEGLTFDELSQVQIMVIQPGGSVTPLMAQVNYEGEYRLDNVAAGDWMVMATVGQGKSARETITIEPGQLEMVVDFRFGDGLKLTGRVLRNGEPESGIMVIATGTSGTSTGQTTTGPEGEFTIEGLEPGGYRVIVTNFGNSPHQEVIELVADYDLQINIQDATVTGRVWDEDTGEPLVGVELELTRTGEGADALGGMRIFGLGSAPQTDAAGRFVIEGVASGSYRLAATLEGYGAGTADLVVEGGAGASVEITMKKSVALTVYVFTPSGTPARRIGLTVLDANQLPLLSQSRTLAEGGRLDIQELPDGTWDLLISENNGATARTTVTVPGDPVQVRLPASGGLRLLLPELVEARTTARVTLWDEQGRQYRAAGLLGMLAEVGATVTDGRALINGIPVGVWRVVVKSGDGEKTWETVARVVEGTVVEYLVQ